jgi:hypothetical protein
LAKDVEQLLKTATAMIVRRNSSASRQALRKPLTIPRNFSNGFSAL